MKDIILHVVNLHNGIRYVDLALDVMSRVSPQKFCTEQFHIELTELIISNEIVEIEYTDPHSQQHKFMYFVVGTIIYFEHLQLNHPRQNSLTS